MPENDRAGRVRARRFPQFAREEYRALMWRIVEPGTPEGGTLGLHGMDWHPDTFAAVKGKTVELPLLLARRPGTGCFPRLVEKLESLGYRVKVVAPVSHFRDHLAREGWQILEFSDHGEIWARPR